MKKYLLFIAALAVASFSSCERNEVTISDETIFGSVPVTIEQPIDPSTKAVINESGSSFTISLTSTDYFGLTPYGVVSNNHTYKKWKYSDGNLIGEIPADYSGKYLVMLGYSDSETGYSSGMGGGVSTIRGSITEAQKASSVKGLLMAKTEECATGALPSVFNFKTMNSFLKFSVNKSEVSGDVALESITINSDSQIAGQFGFNVESDFLETGFNDKGVAPKNIKKQIVLNCESAALSTETKVFYATIIYGKLDALTITFTFSDGSTKVKTIGKTGGVTLERNTVYSLPVVTYTGAESVTPDPSDPMTVTYPYEDSFSTSQGFFAVNDVVIPSELNSVWAYDATNKYMKATAYNSASKTNYETESWLISPVIDMTSASHPVLKFDHTYRFGNDGTTELTLWARENGSDWTQLQIADYGDSSNWTFSTNSIDVSAYVGKTLQFAFKYVSSSAAAATWEIKNVSVAELVESAPDPVVLEMSAVTCSAHSQTSLTFSWTAVANATGYQIYFDNVDKGVVNGTSYTVEDLSSGTEHTIAVKAIGDGTNYATSTKASTCKASTDEDTTRRSIKFTYSEHSGWTVSAKDNKSYYILLKDTNIVSPEIEFSSIASISVKMRTYGGTSYKTVDVYFGGEKLTSFVAASTSLVEYKSDEITASGKGTFTFSSTTNTTANGPGVSEITIVYIPVDSQ